MIGLTSVIYSSYKIFDIYTLPMDVTINNKTHIIGFNADTDGIHFGVLSKSSTGKRVVHINNTYDTEVIVVIKKYGELKDLVLITPNNFILQPNEKKDVEFSIQVPENMSVGNYTGFVKVNILRR